MTESGRRLREAARRFAAHQTTRLLGGAAALGIGVALVVVAVLLVVDRFAPLPAPVRAAGLVLAAAAPVLVLARALLARLPALRDLEEAARSTEAQSRELRERLVPALQVLDVRDDVRTGYSTELVDAFVDETVHVVEGVRPVALPYNTGFRRAAVVGAGGLAAVLACLVLLGPGRTREGLVRLTGAFGELGPRPAATFAVTPGDVSIPRGESVVLSALVGHARVRGGQSHARLQWRSDAESPWEELALDSQPIVADGAPGEGGPTARFEHRFPDVRESFHYRFAHEGAASAEYEVRALPPPSLTIDEVLYRYPEYTGLPERSVRDGSGDLAAVKGSTAELVVRSTNEPRSATLALESGTEIPLAADADGRLRGTVSIVGEDAYRLHVEDTLGLHNPNPLTYRVRALADEAPFIRLLEPGEDRDLEESLVQPLRFSAVDDFGVGPVQLVFETSRREGDTTRVDIAVPGPHVTEASETWEWDLNPLDLLPGDTVIYHLEVSDNNAVDGPSTARTRDYVLRFPTLGEIYAAIDEKGETSIDDLREVSDKAKRVEEHLEEISREMLKQGESSWENRGEMERALQQQQELADELRRVQEDIESNLDELADSEFATLDALQKMEQIRKLLDEVATQEMKEALDKLREALEQANPREMQDDLADFQESQKELMESLDRIIENLKQFRLEERLKAAIRQVEELAARQERVNDQLKHPEEPGRESDRTEQMQESESKDEGEGEDAQAQEAETGESEKADELAEADDSKSGDQGAESEESSSEQNGEAGEDQKQGEESAQSDDSQEDLDRLAREEQSLSEEAERLEKELKELAEMTRELRDSQDQETMEGLSQEMERREIPEKMGDASGDMSQGNREEAQEKGEKALTELREMLTALEGGAAMMQQRMVQMNQAAINRAVRDLLSVSGDQESLTGQLAEIPRNTNSATRTFADEQHLLIEGAERVEDMLREVAKDTPFMDSSVGKQLQGGVRSMKDAAYGLENGAVHMARDEGDQAVEDLNGVVIALLRTASSMSSCASGMPMSDFLQQLQQMTGDQQKLNDALRDLMKQGGSPMDRRLQSELKKLGERQQQLREQLQQLLDEMGSGEGLLGRLDSVTEKLEDVEKKLKEGRVDDETLREQDWALTRLLDSQRSMRERDFGRERRSKTGEEMADLVPPGALPEGLEEETRDLREDLLRALERRYPPKYEELIRRYFRSLTDEGPVPDLP